MKKVSLLSFYLTATVAIASTGNSKLLNGNQSQNPSLPTESVTAIGGTSGAPAPPPKP